MNEYTALEMYANQIGLRSRNEQLEADLGNLRNAYYAAIQQLQRMGAESVPLYPDPAEQAEERNRQVEAALRRISGYASKEGRIARDILDSSLPDNEPEQGEPDQYAHEVVDEITERLLAKGYEGVKFDGDVGPITALVEWIDEQIRSEPAPTPPETIDLSKRDLRPKRYGWAPGYYVNTCQICGKQFVGDKWAWNCAPCAYIDAPTPDGGEGALEALILLTDAAESDDDLGRDDGRTPREEADRLYEIVRRSLREPRVPEIVWSKLRKIEQDAPRPFSECACTIRYELDRALGERNE